MAKIKEVKPSVERISQWGSCTEVIYKCPVCDTGFAALGHNVNFCYKCGQPLSWGVIIKVNSFVSNLYHTSSYKKQRSICETLDEFNRSVSTDGTPVELIEYNKSLQDAFIEKLKEKENHT